MQVAELEDCRVNAHLIASSAVIRKLRFREGGLGVFHKAYWSRCFELGTSDGPRSKQAQKAGRCTRQGHNLRQMPKLK